MSPPPPRTTWSERALILGSAGLLLLAAALAPREAQLIVHNARPTPSRFVVAGQGVFLGPGASASLRVADEVEVTRSDVAGAQAERATFRLTAPLLGDRPVYLWRSGEAPCWIVSKGYGAQDGARVPPQPFAAEAPSPILVPGDLLPGIDPAFPQEVRITRREAEQGVVRRGLFGDAAVRRLRNSKALSAEDGPPVAPASTGALRARQLVELLLAAALGALLGGLGVLVWRWQRRRRAAGRTLPAAPVLVGTFGLLVIALLPFGRFAPWVPEGDTRGFSYSILDMEPHDEGGHVAYLPSLLFDRDVDLYDADERLYYLRTQLTPTGRALEYWTLGTPLVWFPFHAGAHLSVQAARLAGSEVAADGVSAPYLVALGLGSASCLLLGAVCCLGLGRRFGTEAGALAAAALVAFSTPLVFYGLIRTRMDHAVEFFALAAAAWAWFALRERSRGRLADLGLGLLWGIAITTRQSNVVLLAGPLLDLALRLFSVRRDAVARGELLRRIGWAGAGLALPCLLHLVLLTTLWGVPYSLGQRGMLEWPPSLLGKLRAIWFGNWGIAILSPMWLLGVAGLALEAVRPPSPERRVLAALCLVELAAAFAIAVLLPEWRLSAYGWRHLLAVQVFLLPGLVRIADLVVTRRLGAILIPVVAGLVVWQYLFVAQYPVRIDDTTSDFTGQALAHVPHLVTSERIVRSTSLPRILYRAATVEAPVPARDLAWVAAMLLLFVGVPALLALRLDVWARRPARARSLGWALERGVIGVSALLILLLLALLPGVPGLDARARAGRALASARRHVVDPLDALSTYTRADLVAGFVAEARRLDPTHPQLARTEMVVAARFGEPRAALAAIQAGLRQRPDDAELASAAVIALQRTGPLRHQLRAPLEAAVAADPRNLRDRLTLLELLLDLGEPEPAAQLLVEARRLARRPRTARRLDALAARIGARSKAQPTDDPPARPASDPRLGPGPDGVRWVPGDVHLHSESANQANPRSLDTAAFEQELAEQGLAVGCVLAWGLRPEATARRIPRSTAAIVRGTEVSDFGNGYPDHVLMLGVPDLGDFPRRLWALPIIRWARSRGALVGVAHANHWSPSPDRYPLRITQSPFEYPACVALGEEAFLCTEVVRSEAFRRLYYGLLNCGFRIALAGGSDWPVAGQHAGDTRTYVALSGPVSPEAWLEGVRRGRTVVAEGRAAFAALRVGSALPGATVHRAGPGEVVVDVLTSFAAPRRVELIVNGAPVERLEAPAGVTERRLRVRLVDSAWLAVRAGGVHTGALWVEVGGRPVRASVRDARYFVRYVDVLLERLGQADFVPRPFVRPAYASSERAAAQAEYGKARAVFARIAEEAEARLSARRRRGR